MKQFLYTVIMVLISAPAFAYMDMDAEAEMKKVETMIQKGQAAKAEAKLMKIIDTYSEFGPAYTRIALLKLESGDKKEAADNITRALRTFYGNEEAAVAAETIIPAATEECLAAIEAEFEVNPFNNEIKYWLGRCYELLERYDDARLIYKGSRAVSDKALSRLKLIADLSGKPAKNTSSYIIKRFETPLTEEGNILKTSGIKINKHRVDAQIDTSSNAVSCISDMYLTTLSKGKAKVKNGITSLSVEFDGKSVGVYKFKVTLADRDEFIIAKDVLEKMGDYRIDNGTLSIEKTTLKIANIKETKELSEMYSFKGGNSTFQQWVSENLVYPGITSGNPKKEYVVIVYQLDNEGNVTNVRVRKPSTHYAYESIAVEVISSSPKWTPLEGSKVEDKIFTLALVSFSPKP